MEIRLRENSQGSLNLSFPDVITTIKAVRLCAPKIHHKEILVASYVFCTLGSENLIFVSPCLCLLIIFFSLECLAGKIFGKLFQKVQLKRYDTYFIYLPWSVVVTTPATVRNIYYISLLFFRFFVFLRKSSVSVFVNDSTAAETHWFGKRVAKVY